MEIFAQKLFVDRWVASKVCVPFFLATVVIGNLVVSDETSHFSIHLHIHILAPTPSPYIHHYSSINQLQILATHVSTCSPSSSYPHCLHIQHCLKFMFTFMFTFTFTFTFMFMFTFTFTFLFRFTVTFAFTSEYKFM